MARGQGDGGYTGMMVLAAVSMTIGVLALVLEAGDYGWESKPASAAPKANVPPLIKPAVAALDVPAPAVAAAEPATPAAEPAKPTVAATPPALLPGVPVIPPVVGPTPSPLVKPPVPVSQPPEDGTPKPSPLKLQPRPR